MEKEFDIEIVRTGIGFRTIRVKAKNQKEAEEKALEEAGDHEFSEKDAEYDVADSSNKKLEAIYHEIDMECISETDTVSMDTIRKIFAKHGANEKNLH